MGGKDIRMERIMDRGTGNFVIVPMDHGISMGPLPGLSDLRGTVDAVADGGATAVVMNKGAVEYGFRGAGRDIGLVMHLSASTDMGATGDEKVLVATVEEAVKSGADAVSMHINLGAETEPEMLRDLGHISERCREWGMPLLVMTYPRCAGVENRLDPELVAHGARIAAELGADVVKCSYTGDPDSFGEIVKGTMAPVVIAGGPDMLSDEDMLRMVRDSMDAGGRGVSIGRNIFRRKNVKGMTRAIADIVLRDLSVEEAMKNIK